VIFIINIISASCKRNDELRAFQAVTIEHLVDIGEIETGKELIKLVVCKDLEIADEVHTSNQFTV
jgi:hypothetical protein